MTSHYTRRCCLDVQQHDVADAYTDAVTDADADNEVANNL